MKQSRTVLESKRFGIYSCLPDTLLLDVSRQMVDKDAGSVIVVDDAGFLEGIVTRFDLVQACLQSNAWEALPASAVMTREVVTAVPETTMYEVAQLLSELQIHRVVVVREENGRLRPISVVSASDLIYHMVQDA